MTANVIVDGRHEPHIVDYHLLDRASKARGPTPLNDAYDREALHQVFDSMARDLTWVRAGKPRHFSSSPVAELDRLEAEYLSAFREYAERFWPKRKLTKRVFELS